MLGFVLCGSPRRHALRQNDPLPTSTTATEPGISRGSIWFDHQPGLHASTARHYASGWHGHLLAAAAQQADIEAAFDDIVRYGISALAVAGSPFFDTQRANIIALAARHGVPASYHLREYAEAGGLMSYGIDLPDVYRQVGLYTGQILKGAKAGDLPITQPTKFELVINLKTAKTLGLAVPPTILATADEVIE